jgi:hypothetical protein
VDVVDIDGAAVLSVKLELEAERIDALRDFREPNVRTPCEVAV